MRLGCLSGTCGAPHGCALFDILGSFWQSNGEFKTLCCFVAFVHEAMSMCKHGWRQIAQYGCYVGKNYAQTPPHTHSNSVSMHPNTHTTISNPLSFFLSPSPRLSLHVLGPTLN